MGGIPVTSAILRLSVRRGISNFSARLFPVDFVAVMLVQMAQQLGQARVLSSCCVAFFRLAAPEFDHQLGDQEFDHLLGVVVAVSVSSEMRLSSVSTRFSVQPPTT